LKWKKTIGEGIQPLAISFLHYFILEMKISVKNIGAGEGI